MQYHAYALAVNGVAVDLVGFAGTPLASPVLAPGGIAVHAIPDSPSAEPGPFYTLRAGFRALRQWRQMARTVAALGAADLVLVQTPPSVPSTLAGWWHARRRGARFVLDWHTLGGTLFALKAGRAGTALLRVIETWIARRADAHLAVSRAMQQSVARTSGRDAAVVYDRAPHWFVTPDDERRRAMRRRLFDQAGMVEGDAMLLVSPTSFTPDEDLHLLVDAADVLEGLRGALPRRFPRLLVLATGRGDGRLAFEERAHQRARDALVTVRTAWVEPDDYPTLLAAADAGVCTHRSSSGLDLPMKIADMFGVGLPVIAVRYPALAERVRDGDNGVLFDDATGLAATWRRMCAPDTGAEWLAGLRRASAAAGEERWLDGWNREAKPTLISTAGA